MRIETAEVVAAACDRGEDSVECLWDELVWPGEVIVTPAGSNVRVNDVTNTYLGTGMLKSKISFERVDDEGRFLLDGRARYAELNPFGVEIVESPDVPEGTAVLVERGSSKVLFTRDKRELERLVERKQIAIMRGLKTR